MKKKKEVISKEDKYFLLAQQKLAISNCSTRKMKEYLKKKGASKEETNEVIAKLKKYSFLDEDRIVKDVISYCEAKHYGYNRIISMLKQREIDPKKIARILKDDSREVRESKELAKRLIKRYKNRNTVNLKRSVFSSLIRYGFDENIASMRVEEVYISHQQELNVLKLDYNKLVSSYSRKVNNKELKDKIRRSLLSKGYKVNDIRKVENIDI